MTKKQYHHATGLFSTQLALGSFVVGTLLLLLHLHFPDGALFGIGIVYLAVAVLLNSVVFFNLFYLLFTQKNHQEYFTIKLLILLANIPVVFVYLKIVGATWK
ncbi:MAG: hypothetical protein K2P85_04705 [Flavobacteriaceae bacterium]|jgi:hypothetical protein|nr:hypothetical protein [Flavobacteriaceae bacterium]